MEAGRVWNTCCAIHREARKAETKWPNRGDLQVATKGGFAIHSQSVQMVAHAFLANIDTTQQLRKTHPQMGMRYPWKEKRFYPLMWPAQAVHVEATRIVLPMGRGRKSLVIPRPEGFPDDPGGLTAPPPKGRGFPEHRSRDMVHLRLRVGFARLWDLAIPALSVRVGA